MNNSSEALGERITVFREKHSISQSELARQLSVPRSTVWRWETGRGMPSYAKLCQLDDYMYSIENKKS